MAKTYRERDEKGGRVQPVARDGPYVMMLVVTLVAILAGCVLLFLDNKDYGSKAPPKEAAPAIPKLGDAPKTEPPPPGG